MLTHTAVIRQQAEKTIERVIASLLDMFYPR
jgi:hypothetical protein